MQMSVTQGQSHFSELIEKAHNGEVIVITKNGVPWADVYPHSNNRRTIKPMENPPFLLPEGGSVCDSHDQEDLLPWQ
jgi:prevent-host-death family protein